MIVGLDFDGTVVTHAYPLIGDELCGAVDTLKDLMKYGHQIILFTMRSDKKLDEAVVFLKERGVELFGVNKNPTQHEWTNSPKPYCHKYIDDAALGCPLMFPIGTGRPFVDWVKVRALLIEQGFIK